MSLVARDIGLVYYDKGLHVQDQVHAEVIAGGDDVVLLCEHQHVYTFGKSADANNLLINEGFLKQINAQVFETERGGDITYHGPGQLVGYPIINIRKYGIGVKKYVTLLEDSLIKMLADFSIEAYQIEGLTGIWVGTENQVKRKIGAIGIRIRNGVSMHGFALNVTTDLSYFQHIVPCGITDKDVTSILKENGEADMEKVKLSFIKHFTEAFNNALVLQNN
jgi:lipoyl(octanoyl) transferase